MILFFFLHHYINYDHRGDAHTISICVIIQFGTSENIKYKLFSKRLFHCTVRAAARIEHTVNKIKTSRNLSACAALKVRKLKTRNRI